MSYLCKSHSIPGIIPVYQTQEQKLSFYYRIDSSVKPNVGMRITIPALFHFRLIPLSIPFLLKTILANQMLR